MPARPNKTRFAAPPSISDAEWIVMREFWLRGEATSSALIAVLCKTQKWKPPTVQTLIARLVKKGALGFTRQGREYLYSPLVDEADCIHEASRSFVDRVFGGRIAPLVACFLERQKLSKHDIEEMRKLLNDSTK